MPKCIDCYFFKTRVITKHNIETLPFNRTGKVIKALRKKKEIRIYYCIFQFTPSELYIDYDDKWTKISQALRIEVKDCKVADYFPSEFVA